MVIWDKDFYSVSENQTKDVKAVMTFVGGKTVYERKTFKCLIVCSN